MSVCILLQVLLEYHSINWTLLLQAASKNIPILVDAERIREGLDDILELTDYVVCSAKFPQAS